MPFQGVYSALVAWIACTQVVAVDSVTLSADAFPIPGGYVVPERGNVTFTCNSSLGGALFWSVDLRIQGGTATFTTSAGLSSDLPNVVSPDTLPTANPASFTIHTIAMESHRSSVECHDGLSGMSSAKILVEGVPNCPTIQAAVAMETVTVIVQRSNTTWLPEHYHIKATNQNNSNVTLFISTWTNEETFDVKSLQPGTVYNISVTPCNMAGCNEACNIHSVQTLNYDTDGTETGGTGSAQANPSRPLLVYFGVASLSATVLLLGTVTMVCIVVLMRRLLRREKRKTVYELQL